MTPTTLFLQQVVNGLTVGAVYALIAIGYTMVYGIVQLINFAHGEVFMVGGYVGLTVLWLMGIATTGQGGPFWVMWLVMGVVGMGSCGALGVVIERTAYRPLRNAPRLASLITAIGVSFFLQNAVMLIYGARDRYVPPVAPTERWTIGGVSFTLMQVVILATALSLMGGLQVLVKRTKLGMAMRATAQDLKAARLMGIRVDFVITAAFVIGSALAAVGGMCYGLYYQTINFHDGYLTGLKAFTAAVLGGIGNVPGAMVGGLLLGLLESLGAGYLSAQWKNVFAFLILMVILLFKPSGLLGQRLAERG